MTISAKRSLTWLSNLGFTFNNEKMYDINNPINSNKEQGADVLWKTRKNLRQRLYNMVQSSLDHWGGVDKDIFASPESAVNAKLKELQDAWDLENDSYKSKRRKEYPNIVDQLDDIYHNGINGWKTTIKIITG